MRLPRRYVFLVLVLMALLLALFGLVEVLEVPVLTQPQPWLDEARIPTALVGVGLLVVDVFLPVPSSLVMVAHGALFGVVVGTLLSLVGSVGAAALGFWVGRRGGALVERLVGVEERARADALLSRWGVLAILVSRPVPILAETVAIMAGASRVRWPQALMAATLGALPAALVFAVAGALAVEFAGFALASFLVLLMGAVMVLLGRPQTDVTDTS